MVADPDAEVVSLSPKTLMESDRYVCEICKQGFQRDQNLQMHRRRHKVPWKLLKREASADEVRKRVFVCPEPSCLHHDPCHALGDLVGIKKHFRRKHSDNRQWVCDKCSKGYAVQSDYKAHLKTCGTRGHSCDCGRVFSRLEILHSLVHYWQLLHSVTVHFSATQTKNGYKRYVPKSVIKFFKLSQHFLDKAPFVSWDCNQGNENENQILIQSYIEISLSFSLTRLKMHHPTDFR